jgi:hypothetical protein
MDRLSADTVQYFSKQLLKFEELWPHLKVLGVLGSMSQNHSGQEADLKLAADGLSSNISKSRHKLGAIIGPSKEPVAFSFGLSVPDWATIGRSGGDQTNEARGIAYLRLGENDDGRRVRSVFDKLVEEIERRVKTAPN